VCVFVQFKYQISEYSIVKASSEAVSSIKENYLEPLGR
jgi:hypothetical protein